jgi:hypothetical protein
MSRARNVVTIIFLSMIGAYFVRQRATGAARPATTGLSVAVADAPAYARRGRALKGRNGKMDELRDALAGYPAPAPLAAKTTDYVSPVPLGSGEGGIKPLPYDPGQDFSERRIISPSGPSSN